MHHRTSITVVALVLAAGLCASTTVRADNAASRKAAAAYAQQHNLPTRTVRVGAVERVFVPVLANTEADFMGRFCSTTGHVIFRTSRDTTHPNLMLGLKDHVGYSAKPHADLSAYTNPGRPGCYIAMELTQPELKHMVGRFDLLGEQPMHTRTRAREILGAFDETKDAGCMWWLVHAETAAGVNLATTMGLQRSRSPFNMCKKLMHQSPRVSVVGVAASSLEEFKARTDADLLGPAPTLKQ